MTAVHERKTPILDPKAGNLIEELSKGRWSAA
jgi:hypothetical protein